MNAAPLLAIAVSTSMLGWPQHAGPNVPFRKPRWSRKCALTPWAFTVEITPSCTQPRNRVVSYLRCGTNLRSVPTRGGRGTFTRAGAVQLLGGAGRTIGLQ